MAVMSRKIRFYKKVAMLALAGGWVFQAACVHGVMQNIEVLFAAPANFLAIPSAFLVQLFGFNILKIFNN
jgi:hypothetical protein